MDRGNDAGRESEDSRGQGVKWPTETNSEGKGEMKHWSWLSKAGLPILLLVGTVGFASGQNLPTLKGKKVVATVNGEPITLDEFNRELALSHGNKTGKEDRLELLRRLINVRLIIQEGRRMGLDELREIEKMVDVFSRETLREELMERHVKGMKADEKEVDRVYRESVKEWKINSLLFEKEEDARKMEEEMKAGKNFDELSKQFVAAGKARAGEKGEYLGSEKVRASNC